MEDGPSGFGLRGLNAVVEEGGSTYGNAMAMDNGEWTVSGTVSVAGTGDGTGGGYGVGGEGEEEWSGGGGGIRTRSRGLKGTGRSGLVGEMEEDEVQHIHGHRQGQSQSYSTGRGLSSGERLRDKAERDREREEEERACVVPVSLTSYTLRSARDRALLFGNSGDTNIPKEAQIGKSGLFGATSSRSRAMGILFRQVDGSKVHTLY